MGQHLTQSDLRDGWLLAANVWTRVSNTQFTVALDATTWLFPGVKIKWKESGTQKYGVVATSSFAGGTTTVNLIGTTDYVMAASPDAGTANHSPNASPQGFPVSFAYTPTITGYSANPTNTAYQWRTNGRTITITIAETTNGTSNATTKTYTLPTNVTARTLTNQSWIGQSQITNNGSTTGANVRIASAATTISAFASFSGGAWTASGNAKVDYANVSCEF